MKFIKKYQYTNEEVWADTEAIIQMTEEFIVDVVKNEGGDDFRIPFGNDEKNRIMKYKLKKGKKYSVYVYPSSGWILDSEIDELNNCSNFNELIEVGLFMNIKKIED